MVLACVVAPLGSCETPRSDIVAGLQLRGGDFARFDDHLVEIVVHGGHVYAANSNLGIAAMRLEPDGRLTTVDRGVDYEAGRRCTTLAVHAPSDTLYCGADAAVDGTAEIEIIDLSTPGAPTLRGGLALVDSEVRDIEVVDDTLIINQFDAGISTAKIEADGELVALEHSGVDGNARVSVAVGERIVTAFADPAGAGTELRLYDASAREAWVELGRLSLSGPPLWASADVDGGPRVAVALGSGGLALVDVDADTLELATTLAPPAVVTAPVLVGEQVFAVTLSGVFAYELDGELEPRLFGFAAAAPLGSQRSGNMLHGTWHAGELLTSDWLYVERWAVDPDGEVVELDVPRGIYLPPDGGPVRWRMRNPGSLALRVELWRGRERVWTGAIAAQSELEVELDAATRRALLDADAPRVGLSVRVFDPAIPSRGEPLSSTQLIVAERPAARTIPPALGDVFPTLTLVDLDAEVYTLPTPGGSQTIWYWPDCALMWPQLEDLAWLEREGVDLGRGVPVMLSNFSVGDDGFDQRWALDGATFGMWGAAAPELGGANDYIDPDDIYEPLWIEALPGDAMPTDYVMDEQGIVRSIERMYRGRWTLVVPWPWSGSRR